MVNHSATKLDAIYGRYKIMAEECHNNVNVRRKIIEELGATPIMTVSIRQEIVQHQDDLSYFSASYRATVRKMDLVRQLIHIEEMYPTSAFL